MDPRPSESTLAACAGRRPTILRVPDVPLGDGRDVALYSKAIAPMPASGEWRAVACATCASVVAGGAFRSLDPDAKDYLDEVRSIHWSPYDRVRVVNAVP
jgi:hypothetical protein